jgi:hypothetical protein
MRFTESSQLVVMKRPTERLDLSTELVSRRTEC